MSVSLLIERERASLSPEGPLGDSRRLSLVSRLPNDERELVLPPPGPSVWMQVVFFGGS